MTAAGLSMAQVSTASQSMTYNLWAAVVAVKQEYMSVPALEGDSLDPRRLLDSFVV